MSNLIGKKVIDFNLSAYHDLEFIDLSLKDTLGKWAVYFFYPADFTFVCPTELEDLANHYDQIKSLGCEIYSVSCDTHFVHKAWADASPAIAKIKYPMIGDPKAVLGRFFDVFQEDSGLDLRGSFVVNPQGEIVALEVHSDGIGRNAQELIRKIQAAQFVAENGDQACPANWTPGEKTLTPGIDLVGKI